MTFACDLCFPNIEEIGEFVPGYWLEIWGCKVFLLAPEGHKSDELLTFPEVPTPDPDPNNEHVEDNDPILHQSIAWIERVHDKTKGWKLDLHSAYWFVHACRQAGWSEDEGFIENWIWDQAGKMIEEHCKGKEIVK